MGIPCTAFAHLSSGNSHTIHCIASESGIQHTDVVDVVVVHGVVAVVGNFRIIEFNQAVFNIYTITTIIFNRHTHHGPIIFTT